MTNTNTKPTQIHVLGKPPDETTDKTDKYKTDTNTKFTICLDNTNFNASYLKSVTNGKHPLIRKWDCLSITLNCCYNDRYRCD